MELYGIIIWNGSGPPLYPEKKTYKRDSPMPIPTNTQESGPGDRTLYAYIPIVSEQTYRRAAL